MGQYATLWYYSKVLDNVTAIITPNMKRNLQKTFPHISLPAYEIPHSCKKEFIQIQQVRAHEKIVKLFDNDLLAFVNIGLYINDVNLYHRYRRDILCEFQFSESISATVKAFRDHLHSLHYQNSKQSDRLRLVGVHVRRTDYKAWMARRVKQGLVDENFFLRAMELMVDRMGKLGKKERLMFIVTSDDSRWCKAKFSQFKLNYTIIYTIDHYPLVRQKYLDTNNFLGCRNKKCNDAIGREYVHFDLAVMSIMNYNIFDYGTFGFWGAYLSQGEITIGSDLVLDYTKDSVIKAGVEGFIFLHSP